MANITIGEITLYFRDNIPKQAADYFSGAGGSDNWCPLEVSEGKACESSLRDRVIDDGVDGSQCFFQKQDEFYLVIKSRGTIYSHRPTLE